MRNPVDEFERQYQRSGDPWNLATDPYEQERYAAIIAALDDRRYRRALELGASIGVLTERLLGLCDDLVTLEPAPTAVEAARGRVGGRADVRCGSAPEDLPDGPFDLIVAAEVLYYFPPTELDTVLDALEARLTGDGTLIAVHWRGLGTHQQTGDDVHRTLLARWRPVRSRTTAGYRLDVFQPNPVEGAPP